jgi:hypothetical protein
MYLLPSGKKSTGYEPTNTKWGGISTLSGLLPGGGLRYFRPNQAMARGFITGGGLGDDSTVSIDPATLGMGLGALVLASFLFGRKHPKSARGGRVRRAVRELRRS